MKVRFSNSSLKFVEKVNKKEKERIRLKIKELVTELEQFGTIPFTRMNIKKLEGSWKGLCD
jgi:hypothetical protein